MRSFLCIILSMACGTNICLAAPKTNTDTAVTQTQGKGDANKAPNPLSLEANQKGVQALTHGDMKGAEAEFKRALQIDPGNLTAAYNLSGSYIVNEKRDAALSLLREYTTKYPHDAGLWVRFGDVNFSAEKIKDAIVCYEKALTIEKTYPKLASKMGLAYALEQRLGDSERMYRLALEETPKDGELMANLSSVLLGNGKVDEAIAFAKRSAQVNPTSRVFVTLGSAYEAKRVPSQALAAYERAKELGDKSDEIQTKITELQKIKT